MSKTSDVTGQRQTRVFLSYARKDLAVVERLRVGLEAAGFVAFLDQHDIAPAEPWQDRLSELIASADNIVFCLSPNSIASKICSWEINEAERMGKRIHPVVLEDTNDETVPQRLKRLNFIFMRDQAEAENAWRSLIISLNQDIVWVRTHTRMVERSNEWLHSGRKRSALLQGDQITAAEAWLAERAEGAPPITPTISSYVAESRRSELERDRRARTVGRAITAASLTAVAIMAVLGYRIYGQWLETLASQSQFLSSLSARQLAAGDADSGLLLALEALPDSQSDRLAKRVRPMVPAAERQLYASYFTPRVVRQMPLDRVVTGYSAFVPGGDRILTAGSDGRIRLYDSHDSRVLATFAIDEDKIWDAEMSPDKRLIAATLPRGRTVIVDAASGAILSRLPVEGGDVWDAAFDLTSQLVATAAADGRVRIWRLADASLLKAITIATKSVNSVAFDRDTRIVLVATDEGEAALWDWQDQRQVRAWKICDCKVMMAAFDAQFGRIVTAAEDGVVRVLERGISTVAAELRGHTKEVWQAAFDREGDTIVSASEDGTIRLWFGPKWEPLAVLRAGGEPVYTASFSPNGQTLVTSSRDGVQRIWTHLRGQEVATLREREGWTNAAAISPDGRRIATASDHKAVRIWDVATAREIVPPLEGHSHRVLSVTHSPDGSLIASGSVDKRAIVWDAHTGRRRATFENAVQGPVSEVTFSSDGQLLATRDWQGKVHLWNVTAARLQDTLEIATVGLIDVAFGPRNKRLLAVGESSDRAAPQHIYVWQRANLELVGQVAGYRAQFSPDGALIAIAATMDGGDVLRLVEAQTLRERFTTPKEHAASIADIKFHPSGSLIATGSGDDTVRLWDAVSGQRVSILAGPDDVMSIAFLADGSRLLAAYRNGEVWIWDVRRQQSVMTLKSGIDDAKFRQLGDLGDGRHVIVGKGPHGTIRLWQIFDDTERLIRAAQTDVLQCLTWERRKEFFLPFDQPNWCIDQHKVPLETPKTLRERQLEEISKSF